MKYDMIPTTNDARISTPHSVSHSGSRARVVPALLSMLLPAVLFLSSCSNKNQVPDASGSFEADEVIVSAEGSGRLLSFQCEEGDTMLANQQVGVLDTTQLVLRKKQLQSQISAVLSTQPDAASQLATIQEQLAVARREQNRFSGLLKQGAATQKTVDDLDGQVAILQKQYDALQKNLGISTSGIRAQVPPLLAQIDQINDQLAKSHIINPIDGTVLTKYAQQFELCAPGKALYKIANLKVLKLRAYISGTQLSQIKLGQKVKVRVDKGVNDMKDYEGTISWISSKAEFTPKTIQTKDERANLVYALKIAVPNDGFLKIGMYGEISL